MTRDRGITVAKGQRRGRRISMLAAELDRHLESERTCRVATVSPDGRPHNTPLWFAWDGRALWLTSIVKSQRWIDLERDPRVIVIVDGGRGYMELWGVEQIGSEERVGEIPRTGEPNPDLEPAERLFAQKYLNGDGMMHDTWHSWLRLIPEKIVSWNFTKLADF